MRIVHACLRYPPATGGVETYAEQLVRRTRSIAAGRDVRVLTSKLRTHHPAQELNPALLVDDPMYVQRLHHCQIPRLAYPRLQAINYYLAHHRPQILHGHGFWYHPADSAARFAVRHHLPFIFHPYYYENEVRQKPIWQLYKRTIGRRTFAAAAAVVVISPYEKSLIQKAGYPVRRFELIPPGVDPAEFVVRQPNPFLARNIKGKILLSVGRVASGKGLSEVVSALPRLVSDFPDLRYAVAGEDFGAAASLSEQARKLGLKGRLHLLGRVSRQELVAAFQHADVLVHPSHYEAFGIVMAESLAAGTPVVARRRAAIPFIVPHQEAGLLFDNHQEMTRHLKQLLGDASRRKKLAGQGRQHVRKNFTWDKSIKKLVSLYGEFALISAK